jgi:hypothetical protein
MVRCAECGTLGEGSMEGWRAMLGTDIDDEHTTTETYLFCPVRADREFGPPRGEHGEPRNVQRNGRCGDRAADLRSP